VVAFRRLTVWVLALGLAGCGGGGAKSKDGGSDGQHGGSGGKGGTGGTGGSSGGSDGSAGSTAPVDAGPVDGPGFIDGFYEIDASADADVTGTWTSVCCDGKYTGIVVLNQVGTTITGTFNDVTVGTGGTLVGAIHGSHVEFKRTADGINQDYALTLSADGNTLTGGFTGTHDSTAGTDVQLTRGLPDGGFDANDGALAEAGNDSDGGVVDNSDGGVVDAPVADDSQNDQDAGQTDQDAQGGEAGETGP
jgi:hypothetical protein